MNVGAAFGFLVGSTDAAGSGAVPRLPRGYRGGLLEAMGDTTAPTYDCALLVHAHLAHGDVGRARAVGDGLLRAQATDPAGDGRLRASYVSGPVPPEGAVAADATSDVGAMAWAAAALLRLPSVDMSYVDGAVRVADWIHRGAADDRGVGGYTGGLTADGRRLLWKSTEHNLDLVALFRTLAQSTGDPRWSGRAAGAERLVRSQFDAAAGRFATGTDLDGVTVNETFVPADVQTWSSLVLRDEELSVSLDFARDALTVHEGPYRGIVLTEGEPGPIWFEGTAHLALALRLRGGPGDASAATAYLTSLARAQHGDGGVPAASYDGPPNAQGMRLHYSRHVGATAWYVLAARGINPFLVPNRNV